MRSGDLWQIVEDHRGTLYSTTNGAPVEYLTLGPLPENLTTVPRPTAHHRWNNIEWEIDVEATADDDRKKIVAEACRYLAETDWYVTRQMESGKAIPPDVIAGRKAARVKANG
ncbi:hypothetical protein EAH78_18230 [Pseudomonas arsenicoxydans]|uniref:Phage tail protein n=1 Tax=Pseudomonas arsenicoxydans TaxID=702115 RepID=A0A502HSG3_9PSED|nr:hypothetical protein EAH78_18230 [Pseudomonas arsenicoxydans]